MRTTPELEPDVPLQEAPNAHGFIYRNGFAVLPSRSEVISVGHVHRLMDEEGI